MDVFDLIVIGGGAGGCFGAINYKSKFINTSAATIPNKKVLIIEKQNKLLQKVKVSGGGRCNVTNACFDPKTLVEHYPRGHKELLGAFYRFQPADMMEWLENNGVALKVEENNKVFPVSDNSQTIIDCFLKKIKKLDIKINFGEEVIKVMKQEEVFEVTTTKNKYYSKQLLIATGGFNKPKAYEWISQLGHTIIPPIPSLFTFNIAEKAITALQGISINPVRVSISSCHIEVTDSLLITHWGFSGPVILKLSAFGAKCLYENKYKLPVTIDWLPEYTNEQLEEIFNSWKNLHPKSHLKNEKLDKIPKRLWEYFIHAIVNTPTNWSEISKKQINLLINKLKNDVYRLNGKTTFKEEFVTCGGVDLKEVDFKTMESKLIKGCYFSGEVLNIDAVTGGFNFQAAWTTSWIAAQNMS